MVFGWDDLLMAGLTAAATTVGSGVASNLLDQATGGPANRNATRLQSYMAGQKLDELSGDNKKATSPNLLEQLLSGKLSQTFNPAGFNQPKPEPLLWDSNNIGGASYG